MKFHVATVAIIALTMSTNIMGDERYNAGVDHAVNADGCGFDHGYECLDISQDDFIGRESDQRMIPGNYLKAWQAAVSDFLALEELESGQKDLKHYKFGFTESDEHYIVHFQALLLPELDRGKVIGTIRATYGLTMRYWINKSNLAVDKRLFYKT